MSELTSCNYCNLKRIKDRAKKDGLEVTLLKDRKYGGINVYVHPSTVVIDCMPGGENGEREKYYRAWLMALTDHCVC